MGALSATLIDSLMQFLFGQWIGCCRSQGYQARSAFNLGLGFIDLNPNRHHHRFWSLCTLSMISIPESLQTCPF